MIFKLLNINQDDKNSEPCSDAPNISEAVFEKHTLSMPNTPSTITGGNRKTNKNSKTNKNRKIKKYNKTRKISKTRKIEK